MERKDGRLRLLEKERADLLVILSFTKSYSLVFHFMQTSEKENIVDCVDSYIG